MYSTIVVGCDGSEGEADAIRLAERLRAPAGRLVLVNVFPLFTGYAGPLTPVLYTEWLRDGATEMLDRAAGRVSAGVPCEQQSTAAASPAAGLNDLAESVGADLIVLGGSHRGRVATLAGRQTVQRLLHGAPCAVAVANPGLPDGPLRIVVAYDGSAESSRALDAAYAIADARVELCGVLSPLIYASGFDVPLDPDFDRAREADARAGLEAAAARAPAGVAVTTSLLWGEPAVTIPRVARERADLVVAGSRGYGELRRAISGSVSGAVLHGSAVSALVTPR